MKGYLQTTDMFKALVKDCENNLENTTYQIDEDAARKHKKTPQMYEMPS